MGEKLQIYIFSPQLVFANQSCLIWNWDQVNLFIQTNGVLLGNQSIWKHLRNIYFQLKRLKFNNHQEKKSVLHSVLQFQQCHYLSCRWLYTK